MKVLGVIPARGGSKGVPRKNIKLLGGKPLLAYSVEAAKKSAVIDRIIVSTEDTEIASVALNSGAEVPFKRPEFLAADTTPTIDVLVHLLQTLQNEGEYYDALCLLQPTSPFRSAKLIKQAVERMSETGADSVLSMLEVPHEYNPHWVFEKNADGLSISTGEKEIIPRRQALPKAYFRDGAIYLTKSEVIINQKSLYGDKIEMVLSDKDSYVNIDTIEDWNKAEKYISNGK